jgi:hypothetical protein
MTHYRIPTFPVAQTKAKFSHIDGSLKMVHLMKNGFFIE